MLQNPAELEDWRSDLDPKSKEVIDGAFAEPSLLNAIVGDRFQFERLGKLKSPQLLLMFRISELFATLKWIGVGMGLV